MFLLEKKRLYVSALGPLDGEGHDAPVVEVCEGQTGTVKEKVLGSRGTPTRIFLRYTSW